MSSGLNLKGCRNLATGLLKDFFESLNDFVS